jgi:hypothetical protein
MNSVSLARTPPGLASRLVRDLPLRGNIPEERVERVKYDVSVSCSFGSGHLPRGGGRGTCYPFAVGILETFLAMGDRGVSHDAAFKGQSAVKMNVSATGTLNLTNV